jgi:hypothetical protein
MRPKLYASAAAAAFVLISGQAHAATYTYNLNGFTFDDGGTAIGHISFDSSISIPPDWSLLTGYVVDFNVTVAGGNTTDFSSFTFKAPSGLADTIYVPTGDHAGANVSIYDVTAGIPKVGYTIPREFRFTFDPTRLGANSISLSSTPGINVECFDCYPDRVVTSGSLSLVASVPEPETFAMMLAGLVAIGAATRRAHKRA